MAYAVEYYHYGREKVYDVWFHAFDVNESKYEFNCLVPNLEEPACNECFWIVPNTTED